MPNEYPNKPPQFLFSTQNGRFEVGKKICLSISQHHPEEWQAGWGVRTALTAIRSFMTTKAEGESCCAGAAVAPCCSPAL